MANSANCIICPSIYLCVVVKEPAAPGAKLAIRAGPGKSKINQVVGVTGFEPVTLRLSSACSNQLSYTPVNLVELRRFELLTYSLQSYRSTN